MREWTPQQQDAIDATGGPLLVTAAAGSGKTSVLTERIIRLLQEERIDLDRLLIVTFTRAAAAEMQERIAARISALVAECPTDPFLVRQQMRLPRANISTIHSFCMSFIRENFRKAGVECDFRLMDDAEYNLLKWEVLDALLEKQYAEQENGFLQLANLLSSDRDDNGLRNYILRLYDYLSACDDKEAWLGNIETLYGGAQGAINEESVAFWTCKACDLATRVIRKSLVLTRSAMEDAKQDEVLSTAYLPALEEDASLYEGILDALDRKDMETAAHLADIPYAKMKPARNADECLKNRVTERRKKAKDAKTKAKERFLAFTSEKIAKDICSIRPAAFTLTGILRQLDKALREEKQAVNALSFDDLEQLTITLLTEKDEKGERRPTKLAEETANRFDEIMVDEYQDTNPAQALIYHVLSDGGKKLFMVGDVKQAIYSFRNATPEDYILKKDAYLSYRKQDPIFPAKIALSANFRSHNGITDLVNFMFEQLCTPFLGGTVYDEDEHLVPRSPHAQDRPEVPHVELHFIDQPEKEEKFVDDCEFIAKRIEELMAEGTTIPVSEKERRPLRYGDIVVLCRTGGLANPLRNALSKRNIPLISPAGERLLETHEIRLVVSLLKVLDNPYQDVPLVAVMVSSLYGATPDELALIRTEQRTVPFYDAVRQFAEDHDHRKTKKFLTMLEDWRKLAAEVSVDELLLRIYTDTSMAAILSNQTGNRRVKGNLDILVSLAGNYASAGNKGLASFLRYLEKLEEKKSKLMAASGDEDDGVRLMTIHGSKGLEFPVVFLAGIGLFNRDDCYDRCLVHRRYGFGCRIREKNTYYSTLPRNIIQSLMKQEQNSEELRILYVAMTRASQYLFVSSTVKNLSQTVNALEGVGTHEELRRYVAEGAGSFSDWLLLSACLHPSGGSLCAFGGIPSQAVKRACMPLAVTYESRKEMTEEVEQSDESIQKGERKDAIAKSQPVPGSKKDIEVDLDDLFFWQYPYETDTKLPSKVSASAASHKTYTGSAVNIRPAFALRNTEKLYGAKAGTAIHLAMSLLDFASDVSVDDQLKTLVSNGRLTQQEADAVDRSACEVLLASPLGQRIRRAVAEGRLYREYPFVAKAPASVVIEDENVRETVLIRGTVDLLFTEGNKVIVVDFKSDRVKEDRELLERYNKQLHLYAKAVGSLWQSRQIELYLWSFALDRAIPVDEMF